MSPRASMYVLTPPPSVDISTITSVRLGTGRGVKSLSAQSPSKLSFSLMSGQELSLLDVDAIHAAQMAEWTDGLRYLIGAGGLASAEGKEYAHVRGSIMGTQDVQLTSSDPDGIGDQSPPPGYDR